MLPPAGQFWYYRRERVSGRRGTIVGGVSKTRRRFLSLLFVLNYIYFFKIGFVCPAMVFISLYMCQTGQSFFWSSLWIE